MSRISKGYIYPTILLSILVLCGCASSFNSRGLNLAAEANYTQVVKEFAPPKDDYRTMPFVQLIYLCSAYGELKNYQKLFPCLESAQTKVDGGDYMADAWNHSATPSRLKAIALIELGQYEEAVKAAELSGDIVKNKGLTRFEEVKVLEVLGLSYALAGKTERAAGVAEQLKSLYLGYPYMLVKDDRNIAVAKIYICLLYTSPSPRDRG